ncbi:hypothetical protein UA08_07451 [Talaromyces atroroseus]|uniref:Capsule polysaccharide biosynthesis protein n=1 Tax=Talaromyces atroroseus TaxID=1441469 RepID=A0A225AJL4_TALAT|nr:hypothetical protein UA08_07451 [Talaromyces atroroseus]OKL57358.1 hypothetical protein UA08_07451 [Talaromyces atroroseus]
MTVKFTLPPGFRQLAPDTRTDEQIARLLQTHQPVSASEKNVWAFWDSGWTGMRPWCQRNIINWVRRLGPEWTVRVLDNVEGSVNNMLRFVPSSHFPAAYNDGTLAGPPQHLSDLLRLPLLFLYGGVWMDAGMLLLRHLDDICWREIASPASAYEMAGVLMPLRAAPGPMLNGFIACRRGNAMVQHWHAVYCALWQGKTSADGFHQHPLLAHLAPYEVQIAQLECPPLLIPNAMLGDYLAHFLALERLHHLYDPASGFDGAEYFAEKILKLKATDHLYYAQRITGWDGRKQYDMLATAVDDVHAPLHADASQFVDDVLRNSALIKLSHGPPCGLENLASIWDEEARAEDDIAPGTFADYLRYASVSWDLCGGPIEPVVVEKPKNVFKAGVLEPIQYLTELTC